MISRLVLRTALTALTATSAALAHAQVTLYTTGFEAPTYSTTATGNFTNPYDGNPLVLGAGVLTNSNQNWGTFFDTVGAPGPNYDRAIKSAVVQTGVVKSGAQALKIDGAVANQGVFGAYQAISRPTSGGILDIAFDMQVGGASVQAGQWGTSLFDNNFNAIASVGFYQGILVAGSGLNIYGAAPPFTVVGYNNWANYKLSVNFFTKTMSIALNGLPVSSMQNLPLRNDIAFTANTAAVGLGGQTPIGAPYTSTPERAYFDNLAVSSAPEPGTLAFLAVGGALVIVRRRQPRK